MPTRQYRDPSGTAWEVFEVRRLDDRPNSVRPALAAGWLAFVSEREKRRLPAYPPEWFDLGDDELQGLLDAAFVADEPPSSIGRHSGPSSLPVGREEQRLVSRRRRPRITPHLSLAIPTAPAATTSSASITPSMAGGLPVPPATTTSGTLGSAGIEALVRAHARQARQDGVAVIHGMIGVKRALADAGEDISLETIALLRKVFVDEFYFSR